MKRKQLLVFCLIAILSTSLLSGCNSSKQEETTNDSVKTEEVTGTFASEELQIENEGRVIPATLVIPEGKENYPLVVMNHGFAGSRNENGGFTKISEALAEAGIASIRCDFAGCGDSEADFTEFNLKNNMSDVNACLEYVLSNKPVDKENIGVFGYSMGGALTVLLTENEENPYKAIALLAPAVNRDEAFFADNENQLKEAKENGYYSLDWFGNELHVGADYYEGLKSSFDVFDKYDNTRDCIVIYGDSDTTILPEHSKAFADKMEVESVMIEGADHGYGMYSDQPDVTKKLIDTVTSFFTNELK